MSAANTTKRKPRLEKVLITLVSVIAGGWIIALSINGILVHHQFAAAGFTGISLLLAHLVPQVPNAAFYVLINIPMFIAAWFMVSRMFFMFSVIGMLNLATALYMVDIQIPINDPILAALLAGIISGTGAGLIMKSRGSSGGSDILSVILLNKFSIPIGKTFLFVNLIVLISTGFLFSLDLTLYSLIYFFVSSRVVDVVVSGLSQRKMVMIISPAWEHIAHRLKNDIQRGVTIVNATGGFSGQTVHIIYCVVSIRELSYAKKIARDLDPNAFVVVQNTAEVMGKRIGNQLFY